MKKRLAPSQPLFELAEIELTDIDRHSSSIDDILAKRITGLIVRKALSDSVLQVVEQRLTETIVPFFRRPFVGYADEAKSPFMLGQVLVAASPDLEEYFATAGQTRRHLHDLFADHLDIEAHFAAILKKLAAGRPVRVPEGPQGQPYAPATIRVLSDGHGIGLHTDNASARIPQMKQLATWANTNQQLSFFFTLTAPSAGGELLVYGLEWDDVAAHFPPEFGPDELLYDRTNSMLPLVQLSGCETFSPRPGDLLIFDAGRYFHRVTPVSGERHRTTLGGFVALSHDGTTVNYWS